MSYKYVQYDRPYDPDETFNYHVEYDITPDIGTPIANGNTLHISGEVFATDNSYKSISAIVYNGKSGHTNDSLLGYYNKSEGLSPSSTFSIDVEVTTELIQSIAASKEKEEYGYFYHFLIFKLSDNLNGEGSENAYTRKNDEQKLMFDTIENDPPLYGAVNILRRVDIRPGGKPMNMVLSQFDKGEVITFALMENSGTVDPLVGAESELRGIKSNGEYFSVSGNTRYAPIDEDYTKRYNTVDVKVTEDMTDVSGKSYCKIVLVKDDLQIGSAGFYTHIEPCVLNGGNEPSELQPDYSSANNLLATYLNGAMSTYESQTATKIGSGAFTLRNNLKYIRTTATTIESSAISDCYKLLSIKFLSTSPVLLKSNAISNCGRLEAIFLYSNTLSTLQDPSALSGLYASGGAYPKGDNYCTIYVKDDLVEVYKADSVWSQFASYIYGISDYPTVIPRE